jgi:hypothetical protein
MVVCVLGTAYFVHRRFSPATPWIESLKRPEVIVGGQLLAYFLILLLMYRMVSAQTGGNVLQAIRWNWPRRLGAYLLAGIVLELCLVPSHTCCLCPSTPHRRFLSHRPRCLRPLSSSECCSLLCSKSFSFEAFLPALARRLGMIPSILTTALAFASIHASQLKYSWGQSW